MTGLPFTLEDDTELQRSVATLRRELDKPSPDREISAAHALHFRTLGRRIKRWVAEVMNEGIKSAAKGFGHTVGVAGAVYAMFM